MKTIVSILILLLFYHCTNDNKKAYKTENKNDTVVVKKNLTIEQNNSFSIQKVKEIQYFVSVNGKKSNLKDNFSERNDGKVVINRKFDFPNLPPQRNVFEFDELKYILHEAKDDFNIDSLSYMIHGTLDTSKNLNSVKNITQKFLQTKENNSNISTSDYSKISDLILQSHIVKEIN